MNSSLKQLANLLISFIDRTFLPLLKSQQSTKILQQWEQLKSFIYSHEELQIWRMQRLINQIGNDSIKQKDGGILNGTLVPKVQTLTASQLWKCRTSEPWKLNQQVPKYDKGTIKQQQKDYKQNANAASIEVLMASFKKLCFNFENNHKKLVMDKNGSIDKPQLE